MSILRDIQAELLSDTADLATTLLKLRFLASRLGSEPLEEWVRHEAEGYPDSGDVPPYRIVGVSYRGSWSGGAFGPSFENVQIPPFLIERHAGANWVRHQIRQSIAGVQELAKGENVGIDASNLILLLQGKVYEDLACHAISGLISMSAIQNIIFAVRSRMLELTLELEKRVPEAINVTLLEAPGNVNTATVNQIFHQTINGNVTHVTATDRAVVTLSVIAGDVGSLINELTKAGLPAVEAAEFSKIVASEQPQAPDSPLGKKAISWIKRNAPKAASGAWSISSSVMTSVLTEAAMKYYGLKP